MFKKISKKRTKVPFVKIGTTVLPGDPEWDVVASVHAGLITGSRASHFEASLGVLFEFNYGVIFPALSLGYRYQIPGNKYFFRTGVGLSEFIYVGG